MASSAETPSPPEDPEMRNIIDKLALFVAKNGPNFEAMTKSKQEGNPRFAFLHQGGPYFNYYQFRLATEQAILRTKGGAGPPLPIGALANAPQAGAPIAQGGPDMGSQLAALQEKMAESEKNLKAQWDALLAQQETQIAAAVTKACAEKVERLAANSGLKLAEFGAALDALAASCTKEAIANGKNWIFANATNDTQKEVVIRYALERIKEPGASSEARLHILYLVNDWTHHAMRKKQDSVLKLLERYVAPLYVFAHSMTAEPGGKEKLEKLLTLWKNQKYFSDDIYKQMDNTEASVTTLKSAARTEHAELIQEIQAKVQTTYQGFQQQHQDYSRHVQTQIGQLKAAQAAAAAAPKRRSRFDQKPGQAPPAETPTPAPTPSYSTPPPMPPQGFTGPPPPTPPGWGWGGPAGQPGHGPPVPPYGPPPPNAAWGATGPPPMPPWPAPSGAQPPFPPAGQPAAVPNASGEASLIPQRPYYELPAGLMLPLIKMEDSEYESLKPSDLRLPVPMPPPDRVLAALDAFYGPPSHENPRDAEGWERLGLLEYYKAKQKAVDEGRRKAKAEKKEKSGGSDGEQSSSPTNSPPRSYRRRSPSKSPPRRRREETPPSPDASRRRSRFNASPEQEGSRGRQDESESWRRDDERFPGLGKESEGGDDPFDSFRQQRYVRPKLKRVERIEVEMQFVRRHPPRWLQWLRQGPRN